MIAIRKIIVYINFLRFWPHLLCYFFSSERGRIKMDVIAYADFYKVEGGCFYLLLHFLFFHKSFRTYFYYRIGDISNVFTWIASEYDSFSISKGTKLGTGILFFHSYSTIVNATAVGNNCRILHNVTIGEWKGKKPTIGNNVYIYPNAVITGDVTVGDNSIIGPGAVVFKNVPKNCVIVGNPAYILKQDGIIVNKKI